MIDPIPWLARRYTNHHVLRTYRHTGPAAAITAITLVGGTEDAPDGRKVTFSSHPNPRRIVIRYLDDFPATLRRRLEEDAVTEAQYDREMAAAPHTVVLMRDVLDWAAGRLTDHDFDQLDTLWSARLAGHSLSFPDAAAWHRHTYDRADLTPEEWARIGAGRRQTDEADQAAAALIAARLHTTPAPRPGQQLDLFA